METAYTRILVGLTVHLGSKSLESWVSTITQTDKTLPYYDGYKYKRFPFSFVLKDRLKSFFKRYFFNQFEFDVTVIESEADLYDSFSCKDSPSDIANMLVQNLLNTLLNENKQN